MKQKRKVLNLDHTRGKLLPISAEEKKKETRVHFRKVSPPHEGEEGKIRPRTLSGKKKLCRPVLGRFAR